MARPKPIFNTQLYDRRHLRQLASRMKGVQALYWDAIDTLCNRGERWLNVEPGKELHFEDFPQFNREADAAVRELARNLQVHITQGNEEAWTLSNLKNDKMVQSMGLHARVPKDKLEQWTMPHLEALEQFNSRVVGGMNLSERVWNLAKPFKDEMELALEIGIGDGLSATDLSREVRKYLNEPNRLFRRVRDRDGNLRLSKAAQAYHPGRGVYRSSYKNALRMTATENNMAYRTADHMRWQQLDFVIGINISPSPTNHPEVDICDILKGTYPKDFKFVGWHPWCRCIATPKTADDKQFDDYIDRMIAGEDVEGFHFQGEVTDIPECFTDWVRDNSDRIARAKNMPYFIQDNYVDGNPNKGFKWMQEAPKAIDRNAHRLQQTLDLQKRYPSISAESLQAAIQDGNAKTIQQEMASLRNQLAQARRWEREYIHMEQKLGGMLSQDKATLGSMIEEAKAVLFKDDLANFQTANKWRVENLTKKVNAAEKRTAKLKKDASTAIKQADKLGIDHSRISSALANNNLDELSTELISIKDVIAKAKQAVGLTPTPTPTAAISPQEATARKRIAAVIKGKKSITKIEDVQDIMDAYIKEFAEETNGNSYTFTTFNEPPKNGSFTLMDHNRTTHTIRFNTYKRGKTKTEYEKLIEAFERIRAGKGLTKELELSIQSLDHELLHAKAKKGVRLFGHGQVKGDYNRTAMETMNEFASRTRYNKFLERLGGKAKHQGNIIKAGDGYQDWERRLQAFIDKAKLDKNAVGAEFETILTNESYANMDNLLYEFFKKHAKNAVTQTKDQVMTEFEKGRGWNILLDRWFR